MLLGAREQDTRLQNFRQSRWLNCQDSQELTMHATPLQADSARELVNTLIHSADFVDEQHEELDEDSAGAQDDDDSVEAQEASSNDRACTLWQFIMQPPTLAALILTIMMAILLLIAGVYDRN